MARLIRWEFCSDEGKMCNLISAKDHVDNWEEKALKTSWFGFVHKGRPCMMLEVKYGPTLNPEDVNGCEDFEFQREWLESNGFKLVGKDVE